MIYIFRQATTGVRPVVTTMCPLFVATGQCRYGSACSLLHAYPSDAIFPLAKKTRFETPIDQACANSYDHDVGFARLSRLSLIQGGWEYTAAAAEE